MERPFSPLRPHGTRLHETSKKIETYKSSYFTRLNGRYVIGSHQCILGITFQGAILWNSDDNLLGK